MSSGSKKILEERLTAFEGMKAIMEKINRGERLTVEERKDFDARNARITELDADLRTAKEAEDLAAKMREDRSADESPRQPIDAGEIRERAWSNYLRNGVVTNEMRTGTAMITGGMNNVSPGTGQTGQTPDQTAGFLVPPGWWQRLQVALKAYGGIARDFQQLQTESGQPMLWATVDPTAVVGSLVSEAPSSISTVGYSFGQGTISAYAVTSNIQLVSIQLAQDSAFDLDGFVADRVGEAIGRYQAGAVLTGTGSGQPLGIIPALNTKGAVGSGSGGYYGLTAATSINVGGTTTTELAAGVPSVNTLRAMIAGVDPAYRAQGARFYMNDQQLLGVRGLSDANGRPLVNLMDGVTPGVPTSIWGYEVVVDNNIPAMTTPSTTGGPIFGHLQSAMVLRTVSGVTLRRLDERFADTMQVGYIGYLRFDSRSNDLRAAITVKTAAT
jgi:HK97 family phage major capsid protein